MNELQATAVFKSRWGFHPCDWTTYQKLRRLNFLAFRARVVGAAWQRWNRKLPKNRIIKRTVRDESGRPIRREPKLDAAGNVIPIPEPKQPIAYQGFRIPGSHFDSNILDVIESDYRTARVPWQSAAEARPLALSAEQIEEQLAQFERWAAL